MKHLAYAPFLCNQWSMCIFGPLLSTEEKATCCLGCFFVPGANPSHFTPEPRFYKRRRPRTGRETGFLGGDPRPRRPWPEACAFQLFLTFWVLCPCLRLSFKFTFVVAMGRRADMTRRWCHERDFPAECKPFSRLGYTADVLDDPQVIYNIPDICFLEQEREGIIAKTLELI